MSRHPDPTVQAIREALAKPSRTDLAAERERVYRRAAALDVLQPRNPGAAR